MPDRRSVLDLDLTEEQVAFGAALRGLLSSRSPQPVTCDAATWAALAEMGVLAIGSGEGTGSAVEVAVAARELGRAALQGPFPAHWLALYLLPESSRERLSAGEERVALVQGGVVAWASDADTYVEVDGERRAWRVEPSAPLAPFQTLSGERWARGPIVRSEELSASPAAFAWSDLVVAAWCVGAGDVVIERSSDHARGRQQFGRPIGDYQGVAHPLAAAHAELRAAWDLVLVAAWQLGAGAGELSAAAARVASAEASLAAAYAAHQAHGALGYTTEGGLARWTTAIRQMSLVPPGTSSSRRIVAEAALARAPGPLAAG